MAREGYHDSGVEWIGEMPEGWDVSKLGFFTSLKFGFPFPSEKFNNDIGHPVVKIGDVLTGAAASLVDYDWIDAAAVDDGEILLGMSGDFNVAYWHGGKALLNQRTCAISSASVKLKNEYLFYLLGQALYEQNMTTQASIIKNLGAGQIRSIRFPLPPLPEQVRIAEYLDHETGKIDALISELTEFSKILKARTKSLIAECVTKGLPGYRDRAMRDSGVEWIGQVPGEWEIVPLKRTTECLDNLREPVNAQARGDVKGDIPYWGANSIQDYVKDYLVDEEVILLGEDGAPFFDPTKPVAFYSNEKIWPNNHIHVLRTQQNAKYLTHFLNCVNYRPYVGGSTRDKLTQGAMMTIATLVPPPSVQHAIADYLDSEVAKSDALLASVASLIEDLRTYRKALISEVVTGKRRV